MRAHATKLFVGGNWGTQSARNVKPENLRIAKALHRRQHVAETRLGEIAHKLEPLLKEFLTEARGVMSEDALRDVAILKDYMMHKYPRLVVFFACSDTLADLAHDAP